MSRIRIVCKSSQPLDVGEPTVLYPLINGRVATFCDTEVTVIADDGTEHAITNVTRIAWTAEQGSEPARASLDFIGVDVELEAILPGQKVIEAAKAWAKGAEDSCTQLADAVRELEAKR